MKDLVDLTGASGALYRFRRVPDGEAQQRIGGNYALLKARAGGFSVRFVGITNDLAQARQECPPELLKGAHLYVRLNVPRTAREAEHADPSANYGSGEEACDPPAARPSRSAAPVRRPTPAKRRSKSA